MRRAVRLALGGALLAAPVAQAGTVAVQPDTTSTGRAYSAGVARIDYVAGAGERNRLTISVAGSFATVSDPAGVALGAHCARTVPALSTRAHCNLAIATPPTDYGLAYDFVRADLRDGDDTAQIGNVGDELADLLTDLAVDPPVVLDGGEGNDSLTAVNSALFRGGPGNDILHETGGNGTFFGGTGNDLMVGGPIRDFFVSDPGADGADVMLGGGGADDASYVDRPAGVRLSLNGAADDGSPGEGDKIGDDVENLRGGKGGDRLTGDAHDNVLSGGDGNDRLDGRAGFDTLSGGAGKDRLIASDRFQDLASCGKGRDRFSGDYRDLFKSCEKVKRKGSARAVEDPQTPASQESGDVLVELFCPKDRKSSCKGRAYLRHGSAGIGSAAFSIKRGRYELVTIHLRKGTFKKSKEFTARLVVKTKRRHRSALVFRSSEGLSDLTG